jgi:hypothetical protein
MSLAIPQTLLTSLLAAFDGEAKRVAKDAAKILRVPEKEVLQIIKKIPKVQFKVYDDSEHTSTCPVLLREAAILKRCRNPSLLGTSRCVHHQSAELPSIPETVIQLTKLKGYPYWCNEDTQHVYDTNGICVGTLNSEKQLELYSFEEGT